MVSLSLGYFSYRRNLPLTIRSGLRPLFGARLSGPLGHVIDIVAVVATVLSVAQTLGFGGEQFVAGLHRIGFGDWLLDAEGKATTAAIVVALVVIMGLSFFLLAFFLMFGSAAFGIQALFVGLFDDITALTSPLLTVWCADGTETGDALASWQGGWPVLDWARWIAFAPFVGVFLARISRGRTVREYVLGAIIIPSLMCFVWFTIVGGTAIDLTLSGTAGDAIAGAGQQAQLFAMLDVILSYLVTSADSAVLIVTTTNSGGDKGAKGRPHIIF